VLRLHNAQEEEGALSLVPDSAPATDLTSRSDASADP